MHRFVWEAIFPQYCNVIICSFSLYSASKWLSMKFSFQVDINMTKYFGSDDMTQWFVLTDLLSEPTNKYTKFYPNIQLRSFKPRTFEISGCPDSESLTPCWPSYQVLDYVNTKCESSASARLARIRVIRETPVPTSHFVTNILYQLPSCHTVTCVTPPSHLASIEFFSFVVLSHLMWHEAGAKFDKDTKITFLAEKLVPCSKSGWLEYSVDWPGSQEILLSVCDICEFFTQSSYCLQAVFSFRTAKETSESSQHL